MFEDLFFSVFFAAGLRVFRVTVAGGGEALRVMCSRCGLWFLGAYFMTEVE